MEKYFIKSVGTLIIINPNCFEYHKTTPLYFRNLEILRGRLQRSHTYGFNQVVGDDDDDLILVDDVGSPESPQKGLVVKIKSVHHGIQRFQMKRVSMIVGKLHLQVICTSIWSHFPYGDPRWRLLMELLGDG